jgi:hypothetical protein
MRDHGGLRGQTSALPLESSDLITKKLVSGQILGPRTDLSKHVNTDTSPGLRA